MITDLKKAEFEDLIAKIKNQQENIFKQSTVSSIDVDLQLDYLRRLYEAYIQLKQDSPKEEKIEKKLNLSECGTLPLFDDFEETAETPTEENIFFKEEENIEEDIEEEEEDIEEEDIEEGEEDEEETFTSIQEPEIELEMEIETNFKSINSNPPLEEKIETDIKETSFFEPEIKEEQPEINIDTIEFEDDEGDEDDEDEEYEDEDEEDDETDEPIDEPAVKPTSISDKYKTEKPSLNEIVSGFKPDDSIGMKLQHASVSDLMKSIDMNLKFLFVKSLFKGNGSIFTEEINKINSISRLHDAIKYLEEIKDKYNWDDKSEAYTELYKLVLRKYAK